MMMSSREAALCAVIDELMHHVEELGCTCADNDQRLRYHKTQSRRRQDSKCTGVALVVHAELLRRRALRQPNFINRKQPRSRKTV